MLISSRAIEFAATFRHSAIEKGRCPMKNCSLLIGVIIVLLRAPCALAQISPPFHQCPPVGADTSCAILIEIDSFGSLRVFTDPSQGPYDRIEDTLIGVQNDSSHTVTAFPLNSGAPIFDFDGDGICGDDPNTGVPYVPAPSGCPFGPTTYEGPGVSFSVASSTSGVVNFIGGLAPGASTYFSLEGAIQTQCSPITAPARLAQDDPAWGAHTYDHISLTIADYGCFLSDCAMLINYYAARQGSTFRTNPDILNTYLNNDQFTIFGIPVCAPANTFGILQCGYDRSGNVNPWEVARYARDNGLSLYFTSIVDHRDDFTLDQYLCNGQPPLLYVGNPHWVLATGQTVVGGNATYSDIDPDDYPNGGTLQGFGYTYGGLALFKEAGASLAGLYITAHSPVELLLTAPDGSQTGFNPLTNIRYDGIPQGGYLELSLADDKDHSLPSTPPEKALAVVDPLDGTYALQVFGTGNGTFTIDFMGYDSNGIPSTQSITGTAALGQTITYQVQFSQAPGSQIFVPEPLGSSCTVGTQCQSGFCTNGVCCTSASCPTNQSCSVPGQAGHCSLFKCPLTVGFWRNHPAAWPVTSLTLGSQTYTQVEVLTILGTPVGSGKTADASLILADQLIATKLNIAHGSNAAPASTVIADADSLLGGFASKLPYKVKTASATGQAMVSDAEVLNSYNNGLLTPTCQP
jgi:hypothetical protein